MGYIVSVPLCFISKKEKGLSKLSLQGLHGVQDTDLIYCKVAGEQSELHV